jgi:hypothetical protein
MLPWHERGHGMVWELTSFSTLSIKRWISLMLMSELRIEFNSQYEQHKNELFVRLNSMLIKVMRVVQPLLEYKLTTSLKLDYKET